MFRVGQKVVCVMEDFKDFGECKLPKEKNPIKGNIYKISHIKEKKDLVFLIFEGWLYTAFISSKFKPLELDYNFVEEVLKQVQPQEELV